MHDFLLAYALFSAKTITLVLITLAALISLFFALSQRTHEGESIEIEKINDQIEAMRETLESAILTKVELKELHKERRKAEKKALKEAKRAKTSDEPSKRPRLFVLRFEGDLEASEVDKLRQSVTGILSVASSDDEVLIILESAGGFVHHYGLAASQLQRIRQHNIPLTASIDLVAASGGYLMASVAHKIIAAPFAVLGSIGVLAQLPNFHRLLKKHDIDIEQHTAGEYKTTLTMLGENTTKAREKFKEELEDTHLLFKQFVQAHRSQLNIEALATGEHWYGTKALELKLIDEILTSDDYLLEKSKDWDIFQVNYVIYQAWIDKLSDKVHGATGRLLRLLGLGNLSH
jgi:serine protease SohB